MGNRRMSLPRLAVIAVVVSTIFQIGGCSLSDSVAFVKDFNVCGTILNCDPVAYRFYTSGYQGPGANPEIDPACTYPPYCNIVNPGSDPFSP